MKKIILIIPILILITGCINYTELDKLAVVKNLYLSYQNNEYILKCTTIEKNNNETIFDILTSSGKTIKEALNNAYKKSNKKIYLSHIDLLIIDNKLVNEKLKDTLDFFIDNTESRNNFNIAITENINNIKDDTNLNDFIKIVEQESGSTKSITLETFIKDILKYNLSYLPIINQENNELIINKINLIKDYKIYETLNEEDTIIYNIMSNNISKAIVNNIQIMSNNTSVTQDKNKIKINITSNIDNNKNEYIDMLKEKIENMFTKYSDNNTNIFNFNIAKYNLNDLELIYNIKGIDKNDYK